MRTVRGANSLYHSIHIGMAQLLDRPPSTRYLQDVVASWSKKGGVRSAWESVREWAYMEHDSDLALEYSPARLPSDPMTIEALSQHLNVRIWIVRPQLRVA